MKRQSTGLSILLIIMLLGSVNWTACKSKKVVTDAPKEDSPATNIPPSDPPFIVALKESIKGKENLPSEEVWENIKIMKGIPAGRLIPIMQMAFSKSLGVQCNHCHERGDWASDVNPKKEIAREMWVMSGKINRELLPAIEGLQSPQPVANCTTCHRGDVIPKTSLQ